MTDLPIDDVVATSEEGLREQALQRVKKRREFHTHLFAYLTINVLLWGVWAIIGVAAHSWYPWPLWVTLGWGIDGVWWAISISTVLKGVLMAVWYARRHGALIRPARPAPR